MAKYTQQIKWWHVHDDINWTHYKSRDKSEKLNNRIITMKSTKTIKNRKEVWTNMKGK